MTLKISKERSLPVSAVTQKLAWLGTTGSGKTYGASKMAEEMWREGAQFVVLDPVGVWYGMRLAEDGKHPSAIEIPVFGGLHGDIPLDPTSGKLIANLVVDKNLSVILDVSQFESDAAKARFAGDFAAHFYFRKKSSPSAVHLFIEECQEFVPQNPQRGEEQMLHAFVRMQKLGRNFGIGSSYISQRPQEVNKKALNMAQTLFVFRNTGTHERKAIEAWIRDNSLDENIANDLPKIPTGQCHIWSPEFLKISEMVQILKKETFNASATPEVGKKAKAAKLSDIDVNALRESMKEVVALAEKDDPKALRRRIAELEKTPMADPKAIEKAVKEAERRKDAEFFAQRDEWLKQIENWFRILKTIAESSTKALEDYKQKKPAKPVVPKNDIRENMVPAPFRPAHAGYEPDVFKPDTDNHGADKGAIGKGERAILTALAQYGAMTREHITVVTGYKRSSRDTYIQRICAREAARATGDSIELTDIGTRILGSWEPLPTGAALQEHYIRTLPEGEAKILRELCRVYPDVLTRDALSDLTQYKRSSRDTYLQRLGARKLVDFSAGGVVCASEKLFN